MTSNHELAVEVAKVGQKVDDLKEDMDEKFDQVNTKIDRINGSVAKNTSFRNMMNGLGKATIIIGVIGTVLAIIITLARLMRS